MFDKYYMFNEEIDPKLKELGFVLNQGDHSLQYENICKEDSLVARYIITENTVSVQRLLLSSGVSSNHYCNKLENKSFEEIINKLENCLSDLRHRFSIKGKIEESDEILNELKFGGTEIYRMEMNTSTFNRLSNCLNEQKDSREFGFMKVFTGIPIYSNNELKDNECRFYY